MLSLRSFPGFIAALLIVVAPALVATRKGCFQFHAGMLPLHIFERGVHLTGDLVELHAPPSRMQRGLKAKTIILLILRKVLARFCVVALFGVAQAKPPLLASRVHRFR